MSAVLLPSFLLKPSWRGLHELVQPHHEWHLVRTSIIPKADVGISTHLIIELTVQQERQDAKQWNLRMIGAVECLIWILTWTNFTGESIRRFIPDDTL